VAGAVAWLRRTAGTLNFCTSSILRCLSARRSCIRCSRLLSIELPDGGDDECDSESVGDSEGVSAGSRIGGADGDAFGLP
jgi:hypothetical protein